MLGHKYIPTLLGCFLRIETSSNIFTGSKFIKFSKALNKKYQTECIIKAWVIYYFILTLRKKIMYIISAFSYLNNNEIEDFLISLLANWNPSLANYLQKEKI